MISFATAPRNGSSSGAESVTALAGGAGEIAAEARRKLANAEEILKDAITNRPILAIGAALAAGVILGWLIKRR